VWRHTAAVHLLEAGVEVNVISRMARPRKLGNHQSLRRNYSPYQAGRFGNVHSTVRRRREDSAETSFQRVGHITRAGTLRGLCSREHNPCENYGRSYASYSNSNWATSSHS
jgi:hypothetical protein